MSDKKENEQFDTSDTVIAVVGMACHLPGAENIEAYWSNLCNAVESVRFFSHEELVAAGESTQKMAHPGYVPAQPVLENFDMFDARFWGFSPQDAAVTDPAHRRFLEVGYHALEHAGHTGYDDEGTVAVFAASGASQYWMDNLKSNTALMEEMGDFLVRHTGNDMNFLAPRLSYELDLRGPSVNVQTACSSSLVAIHSAIQSLLAGECDMALAGGSTILLPQGRGYIYREGEIMSPDGHCRPFDIASKGTIFGSGAGAVVLRRLEDAVESGDTIYATIIGSAINNDGAQKVGFLAPSVEGQVGAIAEAIEIADVDVEDISYIETHGTGTQIGDPIEYEALQQVFGDATGKRNFCKIGSVKANIGHLGEAAGMAAFIKVVLSLHHEKLPPIVNYTAPNTAIDLENSAFNFNSKLSDWPRSGKKRIAGVNALGAGGTNAHIVVEEASPQMATDSDPEASHLLVLSAKTATAVSAAAKRLAHTLSDDKNINLSDVAYTLQVGRRSYPHRLVIAGNTVEEAIERLNTTPVLFSAEQQAADKTADVVFMFPGGGAQYVAMGADLYTQQTIYRTAFEECMACLDSAQAEDIRRLTSSNALSDNTAEKTLERTSYSLPALFATEYALAKLLIAWGLRPAALTGHSMGEYTAACLAGVFSVADAMQLVNSRGQLFETLQAGAMLSVSASAEAISEWLGENLDIAAINADDLCVVSGSVDAVETLQEKLVSNDIDCTRVRINVAAHSGLLEPILQPFRSVCESIQFQPPNMPITSNVTGGWLRADQATSPEYWVQHLRSSVNYNQNLQTVLSGTSSVLLEVGPGRALGSFARLQKNQPQAIVNVMRHASESGSDSDIALCAFGQAWAAGAQVNWVDYWANYGGVEQRRRIALPGYSFERKAYWIDPAQLAVSNTHDSLHKRELRDDWFARLSWEQSRCRNEKAVAENWLIFDDDKGLADAIVSELGSAANVIRVQSGADFQQRDAKTFSVNASSAESMQALFDALADDKLNQINVLYLWTIEPASEAKLKARIDAYEKNLQRYFTSLLNLSKAILNYGEPAHLAIVTTDMQSLTKAGKPEQALISGAVHTLPHEAEQIVTQSIDISASALQRSEIDNSARQIINEFSSENADRTVAYRGIDRWVQKIVPDPLSAQPTYQWLPQGAVVLISGGLGGIGLTIANQLAEAGAGHLILVGRSGLPERSNWNEWLQAHAQNDATAKRIHCIQRIEALGVKVSVCAADVTDLASLKQTLAESNIAIKSIHGVIHAAGHMNDQLILEKSATAARQVIDVKVKGALVLDALIADQPLEFFVLFSSVASFLGLPGQIDYTAANAFLDAFARERRFRSAGKTLALNWNAWQQVGMAVDAHESALGLPANAERLMVDHPLLDSASAINSGLTRVIKTFSRQDWLLAEHKTKNGVALIPGTGFIELLRAAFGQHCATNRVGPPQFAPIELLNVQFLSVFALTAESKDIQPLHIDVAGSPQSSNLMIYSETKDTPHVLAEARLLTQSQCIKRDVDSLKSRIQQPMPVDSGFLDQNFMDFGPRWACINAIYKAGQEALIYVELANEFSDDIKAMGWHPALTDMAIGGAQFLIKDFNETNDFYVPIGYQHLRIYAATPQRFYSHLRIQSDTAEDIALFDVELIDSSGNCFVQIEKFAMKKVASDFSSSLAAGLNSKKHRPDALEAILRDAITPEEGVDAFNRAMNQSTQAQWIISSVDPQSWLNQLNHNSLANPQKDISFVRENTHNPDADPDIIQVQKCLIDHSAVAEVVVRSFLNEIDERRLIAFYVSDWDNVATVSDLREYASNTMDSTLVPQQFIEIDEFNVDKNGVIITSDLKDPFALEESILLPESSTEIKLASIWQNVLKIEKISLSDNFFDLGGHSLLSIRVIVRCEKEFGVILDQAIMIMQTLEQIAAEIDLRLGTAQISGEAVAAENENFESEVPHGAKNKPGKTGLIKSLFGKR